MKSLSLRSSSSSSSRDHDGEAIDGSSPVGNDDVRGEEDLTRMTVSECIEVISFGKYQIVLTSLISFIWIADAMELTLMGFLGPLLECDMHLNETERASISTAVFVGMLFGAPAWGIIDDRFGRRKGYVLSVLGTFMFGLFSALSTNLGSMLFLRGMVGFCVAGSHVATTMLSEFQPRAWRATSITLLGVFWAIGCILEALLAWIVHTSGSTWRVLLVVTALPLLILLLLSPYVPESPVWSIANGDRKHALSVLQDAAVMNGKKLPSNVCLVQDTNEDDDRSSLAQMWTLISTKPFRMSMWSLCILWTSVCCVYYGVVILSTAASDSSSTSAEENCSPLTSSDYLDALIDSVAELPGLFVMLYCIDRFGRRLTIGGSLGICSILFVCLMLPGLSHFLSQSLLFLIRGFAAGGFQAIFIYTPELFPTTFRASGLGLCVAFARIGGIITPEIATVLYETSSEGAYFVYAFVSVLCVVAIWAVKYETKGRPMGEAFGASTTTTVEMGVMKPANYNDEHPSVHLI